MKKYLQDRENRISLIFFLITMITAISPLISRYCINGHDLDYHLLRIESLKEGILIGKPFLKVNTLFFGGAGYASTMFYSDLFMHIPALLRVMHVSIGKSFHIYTAIIFALCYISTYYCVTKMSMSKFAGTVAAILLTLCPYHMDDMLVRTACGENAAFIFLPLAIYGIFNVVYEEMDKPWVFGLGFSGLILTHPATCLITVCLGVAVFLLYFRKFTKEPRLFIRLCVVSMLALFVTSYQWLPMLEQFASAKFYVSNNWTDLLDASVGFSDLASSTFPCVGIMLFALIIPRFFLSRKDYPILAFVDLMIAFACIFAVGATNIMPWERVAKYFGFLQFPWRLFIMTSTLLAMADAIVLKLFIDRFEEPKRSRAFETTLIVVLVVTAQMAISHQSENSMGYYDYSDDYYSYKPFTASVVAGEWLPVTVTKPEDLTDQSEHFVFDDGSECDFTRERATVIADISDSHEYADVPFVYYKGYRAVIEGGDGSKTVLDINGEGDNGMCRVALNGATGTLTVKYAGTILQYVALIITHLFLLLIFDLVYLKNKYKKKLKSRAAAAGANLGKIACMAVSFMIATSLCACSVNVDSETKSTSYSNPDEVIDLLKGLNNEAEDAEAVDEGSLIKVNCSKKGYDSKGKSYAVLIDESSGEQVISVIPADEAKELSNEEITVTDGLYEKLLADEVKIVKENYRTGSLKTRVMNATDALLCMEVFPESAKRKNIASLAKELGDDILNIPEDKISDIPDKYNYAAVIAKAAYVLPDWEKTEYATGVAEEFFKDAESQSGSDAEPVASRLWAAAELYRLTGSKTYRSVVDAIAMDVVTEGFSYEEPGYLGLFAYLMSPYPTNYNVCTNMMEVIFSKANALIKQNVESEFANIRLDGKTKEKEADRAALMLEEVSLVTMTNYISVSVEYKGYVQDRLNYIYGANLSGVDFTQDDNILCDAPMLFVLTGLS
ncbi:MAG: hypothetical protein K6F87_09555 [Lachnospiraceae bacterium]|nr:hypothetical protein [Lachnospiraceae bacterium]